MDRQPTTQKGQHIANLTEDEARAYVENLIWPNGPACPHCGSKDAYKMDGESCRDGLHRCRPCDKQFTVTVGTIFEDSHLGLRIWVRAFHLMCSSKKGVSALQLQRNLGLGSYRTAWHLAHRIRLAMKCEPFATLLSGTVEADETYVGGKRRGHGYGAGLANKTPVFALVERGGQGRKRSMVMPRVTAQNVRQAIIENVEKGATVNTDDANIYAGVRLDGYVHEPVNHSKGEYVRRFKSGKTITTNTVEGSFALLKRGITGAFHHVSKEHLHRYVGEFDYRWNERGATDVDRTATAVRQAKGKRLSYKPLVAARRAAR